MVKIDIKMPESCEKCPCYHDEYEACKVKKRKLNWIEYLKGKPEWCPLIEAK